MNETRADVSKPLDNRTPTVEDLIYRVNTDIDQQVADLTQRAEAGVKAGEVISEAFDLWQNLLTLSKDARLLSDQLERVLVTAMPDQKHLLPNGQVLARRWSRGQEKWDTKRLLHVVAREAIEAGYDPVEVMGACAAITYWRKGELKKLGVNPDRFCEQDGGRYRVVVEERTDG